MKETITFNPSGISEMNMTTRPFLRYTWKKARQIPSGKYIYEEAVGVARCIVSTLMLTYDPHI